MASMRNMASMGPVATEQMCSLTEGDIKMDSRLEPVRKADDPFLVKIRHQMLDAHNAFREHHGVPPLVQCHELDRLAQIWAERIALKNEMSRENVKNIGENIHWQFELGCTNFPGWNAVNAWYSNGINYRFPMSAASKPVTQEHDTIRFSQVVWKATKKVGFGRAVSKTGRVYTVAKYTPAGNCEGQFDANVLLPKGGKLMPAYKPV